MGSVQSSLPTKSFFTPDGGLIWYRLHSERDDICDALLGVFPKAHDVKQEPPTITEATKAAKWHQELLQARLRRIDDALDRLMSGSYGRCCKCGSQIDESKLKIDAAIAYCADCWASHSQAG